MGAVLEKLDQLCATCLPTPNGRLSDAVVEYKTDVENVLDATLGLIPYAAAAASPVAGCVASVACAGVKGMKAAHKFLRKAVAPSEDPVGSTMLAHAKRSVRRRRKVLAKRCAKAPRDKNGLIGGCVRKGIRLAKESAPSSLASLYASSGAPLGGVVKLGIIGKKVLGLKNAVKGFSETQKLNRSAIVAVELIKAEQAKSEKMARGARERKAIRKSVKRALEDVEEHRRRVKQRV
jgi:hypothetical protein